MLAFCNEVSATFARLLAYIGALAVLAAIAAKLFGGVEAAVEPQTRSQWIDIERPHRAFALVIPDLAEAGYAIQRHPGGGRKDTMTWGEADGPGSRLMVEIYRPGSELAHFADPASEIAARLGDLGTATSLKPGEPIDSKFGRVTPVDFLAKRDRRVQHCLGFVRAFDEPRLQIAGWYCKGYDEIIDSNIVTCALDRLAVLAAGSDPKMAELFSHAELSRQFCQRKPSARGATLRRNDWIAAARAPKLRGRRTTR